MSLIVDALPGIFGESLLIGGLTGTIFAAYWESDLKKTVSLVVGTIFVCSTIEAVTGFKRPLATGLTSEAILAAHKSNAMAAAACVVVRAIAIIAAKAMGIVNLKGTILTACIASIDLLWFGMRYFEGLPSATAAGH